MTSKRRSSRKRIIEAGTSHTPDNISKEEVCRMRKRLNSSSVGPASSLRTSAHSSDAETLTMKTSRKSTFFLNKENRGGEEDLSIKLKRRRQETGFSKKDNSERQRKKIKKLENKTETADKCRSNIHKPGCSKFVDEHSSSDSDDEWLDVDDPAIEDKEYDDNDDGHHDIEVTIGNDEQVTEEDKVAKYVRLEVNKRIKEKRLKCHKVHLLCYIGHLKFWVRGLVRSEFLKPLCLSLIPSGYVTAAFHCFDISLAERFLNWLTSVFVIAKDTYPVTKVSSSAKIERLEKLINDKVYEDDRDFALITFLFFLALNQSVRLVMSCQPLPFKVNIDNLISPKTKLNVVTADGKLRCFVGDNDAGVKKIAKTDLKKKTIKKQKTKSLKESSVLKRNYWIEFWDETTEQWICVDPWTKEVDRPETIEKLVTLPIHYVIAVDNDFGVRDVTARYASKYLYSEVRHLRVDQKWWDATLKLFRSKKRSRNRLEDVAIHDRLMSQPMPLNISDFKSHPLYVLKKDLLKFEAIYPPDQPPIGKVRNVEVYPRSCVYHLDGAANWIKKARSIKPGEEPYKIVKARPDIRIPKDERPTDKTLGLYGYWQTEPFVPPKVINGRIPRNEHGNLYLYKRSMLPEGCAYLQLDGIYGVARRLGFECVPCVVGWEFHKNGNHPIIDGCAVLEKDEAKLREAWSQEFEKKALRARQRCRDRAKKNWRRLYRGVILMRKMKEKFSGGDNRLMNVDEQFETSGNDEKIDDPTLLSWPKAEFKLPLAEDTGDE